MMLCKSERQTKCFMSERRIKQRDIIKFILSDIIILFLKFKREISFPAGHKVKVKIIHKC